MTTPPGSWVERWLSAPRFDVYLRAAGRDRTLALELYEWNAAMSTSIMHDLAHLEVGMRNLYDRQLTAGRAAGAPHWTQDIDPGTSQYFAYKRGVAKDGTPIDLNQRSRKQLSYALSEVANPVADPGKVVAELTFGFWRYLTISHRDTDLWLPVLRTGFRAGTTRKDVDLPMAALHGLRNRVAHHEPLLKLTLPARRKDVRRLLARIAPEIDAHVQLTSTWVAVYQQRPSLP